MPNAVISSGSVDVIISWETFHHIDIESFYFYMKEFYRILKPRGITVINYLSIHNKDAVSWFKKSAEDCLDKDIIHPSIFRFHHPETIRILAEDIGYTVADIEDSDFTENNRRVCLLRK